MKLEEMRYFVEIVDAGSINQASKTLFVAQPALSRTVAALEQELGFSLLERSKQGVTPTAEGRRVYEDCLQILALYGDCERRWEELAYRRKEDEAPVTIPIVALPMICNSTMNQVFIEIAKNYPRIQLRLFERQLGDILETAIAQPHTIAISHYNSITKSDIYAFAKAHDMQVLPLFDDEYCFFASADNPLTRKKQIATSELRHYAIASYSDEKLETDKNFIDAGLTNMSHLFGRMICLSNRYDMMNLAANSDQVVTLSAKRMTRDTSFRQSNRLKPLQIASFHVPMTYFILFSAQPTIEERIAVGMLQAFYQSLGDAPLDET